MNLLRNISRILIVIGMLALYITANSSDAGTMTELQEWLGIVISAAVIGLGAAGHKITTRLEKRKEQENEGLQGNKRGQHMQRAAIHAR